MKAIFEKLHTLRKFTGNKGIWNTLNILSEYVSISQGITLKVFYKILNTHSYYNSFFRAKKPLLKYQIIEIYTPKEETLIRLTPKGQEIYALLIYIKNKIEGRP